MKSGNARPPRRNNSEATTSVGDVKLIDGLAVNGTARVIGWLSAAVRSVQSGYIYHYAFAMIIGLFLLLTFFLRR